MADITIDEALRLAMSQEESVRDAILTLDEEFRSFRDSYMLPNNASQWAPLFAARVASHNKEYRHRIKQDLHVSTHNLKHLYSEGGDGDDNKRSNAMNLLLSMIIGALKTNRTLNRRLDEYINLHTHLLQGNFLSLADRVFIRKTLPDLERCREKLARDAVGVKELFDAYKPCLYVISYKRELKKCEEALSARKTTKGDIERETAPVFRILSRLFEDRKSIFEESTKLGHSHAVAWFSLSTDRVDPATLRQALAQYDVLRDRVWAQKAIHDASVNVIKDIAVEGEFAPSTVPGADGKEVPINTMRQAFDVYERICASCSGMVQLADPIIETLVEYLAVLRLTEAHVLAGLA
ncbi:hypothetical protein C2E23DRAFT_883097 [Lenzites betulinus]|nr:hypothetical protein C2E23DRAFT_883097 [Lenzites betulinus]